MNQPFHAVRHEGPFIPMFEGRDVRLGIGALVLDLDHFDIHQPQRTWVMEPSHPQPREFKDTLTGAVYGHGNVEFSRSKGSIEVDADEIAIIPHGSFETLTERERETYPAAEWKFSFDYTEPPTVHPM